MGSFIQFLCGWKWKPVRCHCSIALLHGNAFPPPSARSLPPSSTTPLHAPDVFSDTPASGPLLLLRLLVDEVVAGIPTLTPAVSPTAVVGRGTTATRRPTPASAATARSSEAERTSAAAQRGLRLRLLLPPLPVTSADAASAAGSGVYE